MNGLAKGRDRDAFPAPFVGANHSQKLAQGSDIGRTDIAVGLPASRLNIRRATQRDAVIGLERQQQHAQRAGALRLRLALQVEGLRGRVGDLARLPVNPPRQGQQ